MCVFILRNQQPRTKLPRDAGNRWPDHRPTGSWVAKVLLCEQVGIAEHRALCAASISKGKARLFAHKRTEKPAGKPMHNAQSVQCSNNNTQCNAQCSAVCSNNNARCSVAQGSNAIRCSDNSAQCSVVHSCPAGSCMAKYV